MENLSSKRFVIHRSNLSSLLFPSFDICEDTGGSNAFFPSGHGALTGTFQEVSCSQWSGSDGGSLFNGACLSGETAGNWPSVGCGNKGKEGLLLPVAAQLTRHVKEPLHEATDRNNTVYVEGFNDEWILCIIVGFILGQTYELYDFNMRKKESNIIQRDYTPWHAWKKWTFQVTMPVIKRSKVIHSFGCQYGSNCAVAVWLRHTN